jgi:N-ethylmaleimide reductase
MTRSRASSDGVPGDITAEYYAQRASAGLMISEGTSPSLMGAAYARTPAIYSTEQIGGWSKVTNAVHANGGRIFVQIMHGGRIGHSANRQTDEPLVAPSAIRAAGQMWTDKLGMQDFPEPRELATAEIPGVIEEFAQATRNALQAGFDGVELHAASGYLPNQFLASNTNHRTDGYGGSVKNRVRFVVETLQAMIHAAGSPGKVGIKISPGMAFNDIHDQDPAATASTLADAIAPLDLAYLHVLRAQSLPELVAVLRKAFHGTLLVGGGLTKETAEAALAAGSMDFAVFGSLFISNPDLPKRFQLSAPLAMPDQATFYTPGPKGYTDYPAL